MRTVRTAAVLAALAVFASTVMSAPAYAQAKKIVFIAGVKDHGSPGRHEYEKDMRVLAYCLENASNLKGITTKIYVGAPPEDINELSDAALIVVDGSSDRAARENHPLFPQDPDTNHQRYDQQTNAYLKDFDALIRKGVGFAAFHYGLWVENFAARTYYLNWLGGVWVQGPSKNPSGDWEITLLNTDHPILRGVNPWKFREEIFYNAFRIDEEHRTDLLLGNPVNVRWWGARPDGPEVAAWAYEREDGGRGFAYGGLDFHNTLLIDDVRRFVLNGLVWAAGMEVPEGGVASTVTEEIMN